MMQAFFFFPCRSAVVNLPANATGLPDNNFRSYLDIDLQRQVCKVLRLVCLDVFGQAALRDQTDLCLTDALQSACKRPTKSRRLVNHLEGVLGRDCAKNVRDNLAKKGKLRTHKPRSQQKPTLTTTQAPVIMASSDTDVYQHLSFSVQSSAVIDQQPKGYHGRAISRKGMKHREP